MTTSAALLLVSTSLYAGFQWTIRMLVYPQFAAVPGEHFATYERNHQRRVSIVVGPLFVFVGAAALTALIVRPGICSATAAACTALVLATTGLAAVPLHRRLSVGFDGEANRRLLLVDTARLVFALLGVGAANANALTS